MDFESRLVALARRVRSPFYTLERPEIPESNGLSTAIADLSGDAQRRLPVSASILVLAAAEVEKTKGCEEKALGALVREPAHDSQGYRSVLTRLQRLPPVSERHELGPR